MGIEKKPDERENGSLPPAKAVWLETLVDSVAGSIVSRTLVKKSSGTITLFSFDAGQGLSEHTAPFDALVHILDGKAKLTIGGQTIEAAAGQIVLMPANVPHAVHAVERFKMFLVMVRG